MTSWRPLAGLALAALSTMGCAGLRNGANPELPNWYHRPGWNLQVAQRRVLTDVNRTIGESYERGKPELDPSHQRVFVGSADRGLYALRADDLTTLWRFQTLGVVQSEPLYDPKSNAVYFGSNDGALYKVSAERGKLLWRFSSNAEISRRPLLVGKTLYVVNANDTVMAIDAASGKLLWHRHRTPALGMEIAGYSGVAYDRGTVYVAYSDGHVDGLNAATGSERWSADLALEAEQQKGEIPRYLDADSTPVVINTAQGRIVAVAGYAGGVYGLDAETGTQMWANEAAKGVSDLVLWQQPAHHSAHGQEIYPKKRMLIASSGTTGLWALKPEDGSKIWRRRLPEGGVSAPVPVAGALLVSTTRYGLFLFSPLNGAVIDGVETGSGFATTPAAYGRRAYALTNAGVLLRIHIDAPTRKHRPHGRRWVQERILTQ